MLSLRLLGVLSVVVLLHCAPLVEAVPKCEEWAWSRDGNGPIIVDPGKERKEVDCQFGHCYSFSFANDGSQKINYVAACYQSARDSQTAPYECSAPETINGQTALRCYCKAATDRSCNRPELMYNPEGDAEQKKCALELRKMGIIAEWKKNTAGQREIDLQYFTCETFKVKIRPTGDIVETVKTSEPCKGVCGMNVNRVDSEKGVDVISQCWTQSEHLKCKSDGTGTRMMCYCAGSDCNTAARLFDPEGDVGQKGRALQLSKMGIVAEGKTVAGQREVDLQYFTCEQFTVKIRPEGDTVEIPKTSEPCKGICGSNIVRVDAEKGVNVHSRCWTHDSELTCTPREKVTVCYCVGRDCNSAARLFDPEGGPEQKKRALELRKKVGVIAEIKTTGTKREITYKFDDDFGKIETTTTEAPTAAPVRTTAARTTVPEQTTTVDDSAPDGGVDDAATGLSLVFAVVLTILRLI